jgi:hypothetical protein
MIEKLLHTDPDYAWTFLRIIAMQRFRKTGRFRIVSSAVTSDEDGSVR